MIKFLLGHYAYWFILALLVIGLYGLIIKRNLVKKVIGLSIFQVAIILFFSQLNQMGSHCSRVNRPSGSYSERSLY